MRHFFIIIIFLSFSLEGNSQKLTFNADSLYQKNTLVLKLKDQYRSLAQTDGINSVLVSNGIQNLDIISFGKLFPNHQKPLESTNQYGDSLVDISLIYQLKYRNNLPPIFMVDRLKNTNLFEYVERRPLSKTLYFPNDTLLANQYYPRLVHAFDAWDIEPGDSTVTIGIVDTGTDIFGEDLKDGIQYNYNDTIDGIDNDNDGYIDNFRGWDLGMGDNNPMSYWDHHGCFTTGIASARVNNHVGIAGMGNQTKYLPVRICDDYGYLNKDYEGIVYAADHGAAIINNSWGGFVKTHFGQDIVNYATYNKNALVVAAAGNSNIDYWLYPASFENVLSCAATDSLDNRWDQSSYGTTVDLCSPGAKVFSTWTMNGYFASSGTSFSAPGVSAAAALVKSHFPNLSALQIGEQLRVTTDNIDTIPNNIPYAGYLGSGRLNMYKALTDTTKPSIRLRNRNIVATGNKPGDTIRLSGDFVNFLHPSSSSLSALVTAVSPYLSIINSYINLGQINTLSSVSNTNNPILIKISPLAPAGTEADIKISYTDTNYSGFEYFRFNINDDYANLDTNLLLTTATSKSTLGYANEQKSQGEGLKYKNSKTLFSWAGLVVGNSSGKVSSNIYGDDGYDSDFVPITNLTPVSPATLGDQEFNSSFNDDGANFNKLKISVTQKSYAYHSNPDKAVFLNYTIHNNGANALSTLYIGFYVDYDIGVSYKNKALFDSTLQLAYTFPTDGGYYGGLMLLDSVPLNIYNIENDGSDNSVNIYDGFLDYEKFSALKGGRDSAGFVNSFGNDVSTMLSAGPFNVLPGDSQEITFAVLAGDHLYDLQQTAQKAIDVFYNVAGVSQLSPHVQQLNVSPNPFSEKVSFQLPIKHQTGEGKLQFYNSEGKIVLSKEINFNPSQESIFIETSYLPKGIYYYSLSVGKESYSGKLIKL